MKQLTLFFCIAFLSFESFAQQTNALKGNIDGNGTPISGAVIRLLQSRDSSLYKTAISNDMGAFAFENIKEDSFLLVVEYLGYKTYYQTVIVRGNSTIPKIVLIPEAKELSEVKIATAKPLIERKMDKIVVNIANSTTAVGNNTWEMMSKLPSVIVDENNNNVSILGKSGTVVYIDGKSTYLSNDQLVARLKSMDASTIETIEIITNPSSKYDAAGNGGIINIVTKKNKVNGFNGSVMARYGIGRFARQAYGANINYRRGSFNIYANYNYSKSKWWNSNQIDRHFGDSVFSSQYSYRITHTSSHDFKVGADIYFDKQNIVGISMTGNINPYDEGGNNKTVFQNYGVTNLEVNTFVNNYTKSYNWTYNVNYEHKFKKEGESISTDLVYSQYDAKNNNQNVIATSYLPNGNIIPRPDGSDAMHQYGILPSLIDIRTAKVDYTLPINKTAKLDIGAKSSWVNTDNDARYLLQSGNNWEVDSTLTNHFKYKENINAVYASLHKDFGNGLTVQVGLRGENTTTTGHQYNNDSIVKRDYFKLFPTAFVQKQWNDKHTIGLSYSRRIDRPNYQNLNPFVYYLDQYTYSSGNPFLRPQIANSIELNYSYKSLLTGGIAYTHTSDVMTDLLKQIDSSKVTFQTTDNMSSTDNVSANVALNLPITKWFTSNTSLYGIWNRVKGVYMASDITMSKYTFGFNTNNAFKLGKGYTAELNSNYHSPILYGLFDVRHQIQVDFGMKKLVLKDKGTIQIGVSDIFKSNINNVNVKYGNINGFVNNRWDSRRFNISFTYRFSKGAKVENRKRSSGIEDVQQRIKKDK